MVPGMGTLKDEPEDTPFGMVIPKGMKDVFCPIMRVDYVAYEPSILGRNPASDGNKGILGLQTGKVLPTGITLHQIPWEIIGEYAYVEGLQEVTVGLSSLFGGLKVHTQSLGDKTEIA
jgi:hypothetical protein